mgnify:CR=1 FL=1
MLKQKGWEANYRKLPPFDYSDEYLVVLIVNQRAIQILKDFDVGKQQLIKTGRFSEIRRK